MLIAIKLIVNESKQSTKLLVKNSMTTLAKLFCQLAGKLKPQKRLKKRSCVENKTKHSGFIETETLDKSRIKTKNSYNHLIQRPKTD